jgi:hypothetical protein
VREEENVGAATKRLDQALLRLPADQAAIGFVAQKIEIGGAATANVHTVKRTLDHETPPSS